MYRFGPGFHHGPGVFGWFFLALLLALLVVGVLALVRWWADPRARHPRLHQPGWPAAGPPVDPAVTELRMRYARGEIGPEEFTRRAADLGHPPPGTGAAPPPVPPAPPPAPST